MTYTVAPDDPIINLEINLYDLKTIVIALEKYIQDNSSMDFVLIRRNVELHDKLEKHIW